MKRMRRTITAGLGSVVLAVPVGNAVAAGRAPRATPKKGVATVTRRVVGPAVQTDEWGTTQVTIVVRKTTTTLGARKTVSRKVMDVAATYPTHANRSVFINRQAIPLLRQEALTAQFGGGIQLISGATNTSDAFAQSLQAALLQAKGI